MLDCGGGTTDAGTYQTDSKFPLRLNQEVHSPKGALLRAPQHLKHC
jgi:hypothetical protein